MKALAQASQGDLPSLLDTLTVAVSTLDAVGVDSFRDLYLYVVGITGDHVIRDLRVEDGHLIVGPPSDRLALPAYLDSDFESNRRALLLADLCFIMRIWKWSPAAMSNYLRCSEAMLSSWLGRSTCVDIPIVPRSIMERIKRLSMVDQSRFLSRISDGDTPSWLSRKRPGFGRKSIEQMLMGGDACEFAQVLIWALNSAQPPVIH